MDISPEYINMCRKARELQEKWEPKEGDWFVHYLNIKKYDTHSIETMGTIVGYVKKKHILFESGPDDEGRFALKDCVWLPRIDQLITLSNMPWQEFLFEVVEYSAGVSETAEIAALHQLMELLYKKEGNEEDWILCQE